MKELRLDFGDNIMAAQIALAQSQEQSLREFLARFPAQTSEAIPNEWYELPLREFKIVPVKGTQGSIPQPNGETLPATSPHSQPSERVSTPNKGAVSLAHVPPDLTDSEAVARAYAKEIEKIGRYLSANLSVLVVCDKILAGYVYRHAVRQSNKQILLESHEQGVGGSKLAQGHANENSTSLRDIADTTTRIAAIGKLLAGIKPDQALVLLHLDMLAGSSNSNHLTHEARLLTEVLYRNHDFTPTLLGFVDPSIELPKVLLDRFAVQIALVGLHRDAVAQLVTSKEHQRFDRFDQEMLFKNVSGFNALQMRNALRYMYVSSQPATPSTHLMELIREFKRDSGEGIEIPDVTFDHIGGYVDVKHELFEAIELITGWRPPFHPDGTPYTPDERDIMHIPESDAARMQRRRLAPRGFLFYGPPGTGKTLFARAVANCMNATIQMVSGPEVMDMWVGKSESNLRQIFAVARHNAPSVIFFDEFDSIATQRGNVNDGGSRASNGVVAQLLAEMDGFQADQDILVIGTTNRVDIIDDALLRPSRFQPIEIGLPDAEARHHIARIHATLFGVEQPSPSVMDTIVEQTDGFSGDEIRAVFQVIARDIRRQKPITLDSFEQHIAFIRARHKRHI